MGFKANKRRHFHGPEMRAPDGLGSHKLLMEAKGNSIFTCSPWSDSSEPAAALDQLQRRSLVMTPNALSRGGLTGGRNRE